MNTRSATTLLKRECEFLGLSMNNLFTMIRRNPGAFNNHIIEAYNVYTRIN